MSNEEQPLDYYKFSFKKNPFDLKVGRLYQLMGRVGDQRPWRRGVLTSFYWSEGPGSRRIYFPSREPFLVVKLDLYTCQVLTAEGHVGTFSYSEHEYRRGTMERYRFDDIAELTGDRK